MPARRNPVLFAREERNRGVAFRRAVQIAVPFLVSLSHFPRHAPIHLPPLLPVLEREITIHMGLDHPNTIPLFEVMQTNTEVLMVRWSPLGDATLSPRENEGQSHTDLSPKRKEAQI